jgi:hypothetical protein
MRNARFGAINAVRLLVGSGSLIFAAGSDSAPLRAATAKNWCGTPIDIPYDGPGDFGPTVILTGVVTQRFAWGPPGFGENPARDVRWTLWFLELDFPLSVFLLNVYDLLDQESKVHQVQLRGDLESNGGYREFLNRHVAAKGEFWRASNPPEIEDIAVARTEVRVVKDVQCEVLVPTIVARH